MPKLNSKSPDQGTSVGVLDRTLEVLAADGTIASKDGEVVITKTGTAATLTLVPPIAGAPSAGGDDGKGLRIVSASPLAHAVLCSRGFNGKGSAGNAAWGTAKGNTLVVVAYNGDWYAIDALGVTVS